jgi:hypothetical protein
MNFSNSINGGIKLQKLFILLFTILFIVGGLVACTSQLPNENKEQANEEATKQLNEEDSEKHSSKVEFYEFDTNILLTLKDIEEPFSKPELLLQPQAGTEYPKLNGIEAKAYQLIDGTVFIHVFKNNEHLKKGLNQMKDVYEPSEWELKIYEVNNMLFVYQPAYATKELVDTNNEKMKEAIKEMIKTNTEIGYDIEQVGEPFPQLEKALEFLLKGSNQESLFSGKTEGMLNGVSMQEDGTTVVDFKNFSNIIGSTTAEKGKLYNELNATVFQFDEVSKVYYQFDGSFSEWCYWLQTMEEPVTREEWDKSSFETTINSQSETSQSLDPRDILTTKNEGHKQIYNEVQRKLDEFSTTLNPGGQYKGYVHATSNLIKYLLAINYKTEELFDNDYPYHNDFSSYQELINTYHEYVDFSSIKLDDLYYNDPEIEIILSYINKKTNQKAYLKYHIRNGLTDHSIFIK